MAGRTRKSTTATAPAPRTPVEPKTKAEKIGAARNKRSSTITASAAALTAAGQMLKPDGKPYTPSSGDGAGSVSRTWQHAAYGYQHTVPELDAAVMYVGNAYSLVSLELGKRNPDGSVVDAYEDGQDVEGQPVLVNGVEAEVAAAAEEIIGTIRTLLGGQSELMRSYGEKMFLVGEGYLVPVDSPAGLTFDVLSVMELTKEGGQWKRLGGPGGSDEPLADGVEPIRVHRPDPQYGRLATSSVRSCLEILEELVILTRLVRGAALNRMAITGVLVIGDGCDDPIEPVGEDGQTAEETNPLIVDMINAGVKAIDDPASPAAFMPYLLQVPDELVEKGIRYIEFKGDDSIAIAKRDEAVARLARGLDMPYETVVGHQSTTYANAAQVTVDVYRIHLQSGLRAFCDALTAAVLWPALARKRNIDASTIASTGYPPEILAVGIRPDPSNLVARPDRTKDIIEAYKADVSQTAIANSELRDALGLDPGGGPSDEETDRRVEQIQLVKEKIAVASPTPEPGAIVASVAVDGALAGLVWRIAGAAEQTVDRAVEKVGAKVRQRAKGLDLAAIEGKENFDVARVLGEATTSRLLDGDPAAAEVRAFARNVRRWAAEAGHPHPESLSETFNAFLTGVVHKRLFTDGPDVDADLCRPLILGVGVS